MPTSRPYAICQPTGSREALDPELLYKRLLLCLYEMGTNMGLKRMAGVDPRITTEDLRYTRRRYLHKEHLRAAIGRLVNALMLEGVLRHCTDMTIKHQMTDSHG